ncbi:MAG: energy transducer TonB [Bacteroidota bacterium]
MRYILFCLMYFTPNLYAQLVNNIRLLGNQNNIEVYYDFSGYVNNELDIVGFQIIGGSNCGCGENKYNISLDELNGHLVGVKPSKNRLITYNFKDDLTKFRGEKYFVNLEFIIKQSNQENIVKNSKLNENLKNKFKGSKEIPQFESFYLEDSTSIQKPTEDVEIVDIVDIVEPVVDFPDVEAEYIGGEAAMQKCLQQNLVYPEMSMEMGEQGKVYLKFVIEKDGKISNVEVIKGVSRDLDCEAKRLICLMPRWKPGEKNGMKVRSSFTMPINFELN